MKMWNNNLEVSFFVLNHQTTQYAAWTYFVVSKFLMDNVAYTSD